jgi:enoyl-CoA hydratase/carnithine racemase
MSRVVSALDCTHRHPEEVEGYAEGLAGKPAGALAAIRRCITEGVDLPVDDGLAIEREEAVALGATVDFREGLDAFLSRRPPVWSD